MAKIAGSGSISQRHGSATVTKTLIFFFVRYPVDGERRTQHERLSVLRVHGEDPVAGRQARRLRSGRRGHGGRQEGDTS